MQRKSTAIATAITASLLTGLMALHAQTLQSTSTGSQESKSPIVLVELFTSEGCSSCPPADELLGQLDGKQTRSGEWVVGISEHVTYWNNQGWMDPFSSPSYTQRQQAYGERFHLESVYTPQMVINGEEQVVGSESGAVLRAIQKTAHTGPLTIHILSAHVTGNALTVIFSTHGDLPRHGASILAAIVEDATSSNVLHGENSGRTLTHVAVARSITRVAKVKASTELTVHLPIPKFYPGQTAHGRHLILFAQAPDFGPVLAVDTKPIG